MTGAEIILTGAVIIGPILAVGGRAVYGELSYSARTTDVHISYSDANARGNCEGVR